MLTRSPRGLLPGFAAATQFAVALYLFHSAMLSNLRGVDEWQAWGGSLWWAGAVAPALWYWTSVIVLRHEAQAIPRLYLRLVAYPLGLLLSLAAIGFGVAAVAGDQIQAWSQPLPDPRPIAVSGSWQASPGPLFGWFTLSLAVALIVALGHLSWVWSRVERSSRTRTQVGWLAASALLFVVAGNWLTINALLTEGLPQLFGYLQPGNLILTAGLVVVAWAVVRHGTWIQGEAQRGDFAYFLTGLGLVSAIYVGILLLVGLPLDLRGLILLFGLGLLVLTTHALADIARVTLGRLFFPDAWQTQARFLGYAGQARSGERPHGRAASGGAGK